MGSCIGTFELYQAKELRMLVLFVTTCLLVILTEAASITDDQDTCWAAAEQAGVDIENFRYHVGHVIHSLTVEDVRFFFDENFPVDNNIPTVNLNLTAGPPVLPYAPSFPSKFKFPLGTTMNRILLNNDDLNAFSEKGSTTLEELGHAAHMLEMLFKASQIYKTVENLDITKVCPCLVDEEANGIIEELEYAAEILRNTADELGERVKYGNECVSSQDTVVSKRKGRAVACFRCCYCSTKGGRQKRSILACPNVPELTDSYSWNIFQHDVAGPMDNAPGRERIGTGVGLYLYCKIAMLSQ